MQNLQTEQNDTKTIFGEIAKIRNGYAFKRLDYRKSGIPLIRQSNLDGERVDLSGCVYLQEDYLERYKQFILNKGDVLLGMSGSLGKICIYDLDKPALQNQRTGKVEITHPERVNARYFWYFLNTIEFRLVNLSKGTGVNNVSATDIESLDLHLPDKPEQEKIVTKLDKCFPEVNSAKNKLQRTKDLIQKFRRAVFFAATTGELTKEWRVKNNKSFEDTWKQIKISNAAECLDKMRKPINSDERKKRIGKIPYYGANGQVGWIDDYIFDEDLVVLVEDETFVGRVKPFSYLIHGKSWVNNHAHVLRPKPGFSAEYLNICFSYYDFIPLTSGTTGRRKLTQGVLMNAEFTAAPYDEQMEIVRRVEALLSKSDEIEKNVLKATAFTEKLTQSILAKAFRGELIN